MRDLVRTVDEGAAVDWLRRAVATPSVTGDELAFARLVADELESCGADEVHLEEVAPGRPIVWSVTRCSGGGPSLLLSGHLDTVRVMDLPHPIPGCEECLKIGGWWVHLRMCTACGKIGCCDQSPNRHATAHFRR